MTENRKGKVIPFQQSAGFYMKRGAKDMVKNDMLGALQRYRLAHMAAPDEAEPLMALAEILSHMQRFEESNRLILLFMSRAEATPECHFGLACNYFGMREYDYAAESLENCLRLEPDGPFAADAEDFLDLLDDDEAMFETVGLKEDADFDANAACVYARHLMAAADYRTAIAVLEHELKREPDSVMLKNQLALAYFCNGERAKAETLTRALLDGGRGDLQTRCNHAMLLMTGGDKAAADAAIDELLNLRTESPEILHSMAVLLLESERYADALRVLGELRRLQPYDRSTLHMLGLCRYRLGDTSGAQECYRRLMRIDPDDSVAAYYFKRSRKTDMDERSFRTHWVIAYQVPFSEAFRRLNHINRCLLLPDEELRALWTEGRRFQNLLLWALTLTEQRIKKSILSLLCLYGDARAEELLRDFLLRTDQPDELKRLVFGLLKHMGAKEPYMAYLDGRWLQGCVNLVPLDYTLPAAYEAVIQLAIQAMNGYYPNECLSAAAGVFKRYADSLQKRFPRISSMQVSSMAAALELIGCRACEVAVDEGELCARYRISATRLRNAMNKLAPFASEAGDERT
ncbi:MAG: tetratricopeptide repeat protein [Clostridia bacterium]|nr:tetratricopeptide repeat protein [Clostridia bacterium]